jgi:hypothetical protein
MAEFPSARPVLGMSLPPMPEEVGLAELTNDTRNNPVDPRTGERTMSHATVVRYTTRPEAADENEKLIKAVFTQLAEQQPEGLRYAAIRLEDGVSFIHVAVLEDDDNPLTALPAFGEFLSAINERCTDGPAPVNGTVIGAYRKVG